MASPLSTLKAARGRSPLVKNPLEGNCSTPSPEKGRNLAVGMATDNDSSLDALFEDPPELVCPLTHALFLDPVITAAGHVRFLFFMLTENSILLV